MIWKVLEEKKWSSSTSKLLVAGPTGGENGFQRLLAPIIQPLSMVEKIMGFVSLGIFFKKPLFLVEL